MAIFEFGDDEMDAEELLASSSSSSSSSSDDVDASLIYFHYDSLSHSDSDDDHQMTTPSKSVCVTNPSKVNHQKPSSSATNTTSTVCSFMEKIKNFNDAQFKATFHMNRNTADDLIAIYLKSLNNEFNIPHFGGRPKSSHDKEMYIFLWYMANPITFRQLSQLAGTSFSTSWSIFDRVSTWLFSIGNLHIKWPTANEIESTVSKGFLNRSGIDHVVGAIACTYIKMRAPHGHTKLPYFDAQTNSYYLVVQAVCDADMKFMDLYIGEPFSKDDSRVFKKSDLFRKVKENERHLFPEKTFLVGSCVYKPENWMVVPYTNNGKLTETETNFNRFHSTNRIVVDQAFAYLKNRFRRLNHFTESLKISILVRVTSCACILHNFCLSKNDHFDVSLSSETDDDDTIDDTSDEPNTINEHHDRRDELMRELLQKGLL